MKKGLIIALSLILAQVLFIATAMAGEGGNAKDYLGLVGLGAGVAIGFAAMGGGIGQGRAVASALDGIARNPSASGKIMTPMIIGLALIESLVIYALVVAIMLIGKIV